MEHATVIIRRNSGIVEKFQIPYKKQVNHKLQLAEALRERSYFVPTSTDYKLGLDESKLEVDATACMILNEIVVTHVKSYKEVI